MRKIQDGWCVATVREILHRRLYLGEVQPFQTRRDMVWDPATRERREGRRTRTEKDSVTDVRVDPALQIVTPDLWERAHERIAKNRTAYQARGFVAVKGSLKGTHLLSGVVACGVCGGPLHARKRGKNNRLVYTCAARHERGRTVCTNKSGISAADLHRAVAKAMKETFTPEALRAHLDALSSDEGTAARATERAALAARLPELVLAQERLAKAVTKALVVDDEVLLAEVQGQYQDAKNAASASRERLAELDALDAGLRGQRAAIELAGTQMASWVELLGKAEVDAEHLEAARKFLGAVLVGPFMVTPADFGWTFTGKSRLDGYLGGALVPKRGAIVFGVRPGDGNKIHVSRDADCRCAACVRPISGGSDAPVEGVGGSTQGPEMAPHTPHAPRPGGEVVKESGARASSERCERTAVFGPGGAPPAAATGRGAPAGGGGPPHTAAAAWRSATLRRRLSAKANQSSTAWTLRTPRTRNCCRPRLRAWAFTHSAVAARSL
jgi:hypothetical protein